jgi:hypothetical protein
MGDEFALIDPETGLVHAFPRLISLKNDGIAAAMAAWPSARMGPLLAATPKGDIRHMVPDALSVGAMDEPAQPALLLFPRHGFAADTRAVSRIGGVRAADAGVDQLRHARRDRVRRTDPPGVRHAGHGDRLSRRRDGGRAGGGAVADALILARALADPTSLALDTDWAGLVTMARAEQLLGTLAHGGCTACRCPRTSRCCWAMRAPRLRMGAARPCGRRRWRGGRWRRSACRSCC